MKQYKEYKDSGVKWIGEIPSHWKTMRAMNMVDYHQAGAWGNDELHNEDDRICLRIADFDFENCSFKKDLNFTKRNYTKNQIEKLHLNKGDILVEKSGGGDKMPVGRAVIYNLKLNKPLYANFMEKLSLRNFANSHFYVFFLNALYVKGIVWKYIKQTTGLQNLDLTSLLNSELFILPPLPEQYSIACFLHTKASKIDRYISTAEKKIAALDELKQVTIADAVTHGINPNAPMKDSGSPWIGMVPEHWEIKTLRAYIRICSEKNHAEKQLLSVTREQGVILRDVDSKEENHNFIPDDLSGYKLVRRGDFAINKMKSWQGSYGVSNCEGIVSPAYYVCKLEFENKDFFSKSIRCKAYVPFFNQYSKGIRVDQWDLSPIALKNIPFFEPPISEQNEIVAYIDRKVAQIDKMRASELAQIEKLKEYKQRLISDVVTGKVKVTND